MIQLTMSGVLDPVQELIRQDRQLGCLDAGEGVHVDDASAVTASSTTWLIAVPQIDAHLAAGPTG